MSDHYSEDEEEDDVEDDGNDNAEGLANEESNVQRKLHLFQCASVQQSIKRLWDLLPKDSNGQLVMEGYVELNLRLQKALTQEFVLERAIDSAIGDWSEDVREGQRSMASEEFAMFLFELCSLWCGPSVSLLVYLLFLNATFIAVTDARGAHTVGLRPLAAVERLPQPFFDLLSVQGWARQPEDGAGLSEDQALSAWIVRNLSPESENATCLQVQRQVFQVTHDVRSVLLFQEGRREEADILDLVKLASKNLAKVNPIEADALIRSVGSGAPVSSTGVSAPPELYSRAWCPPMHNRPPQSSRAPDPQAHLKGKPGQKAPRKPMGAGRQPGEQTLAMLLSVGDMEAPRRPAVSSSAPVGGSAERAGPPPKGRAFDTKRAERAVNGLVLAGQNTMAGSAGGLEARQITEASVGGYTIDSYDRGSRGRLHDGSISTDGGGANFYSEGAGVSALSLGLRQPSPPPTIPGALYVSPIPDSDTWLHMAAAAEAARAPPAGQFSRGASPLLPATPLDRQMAMAEGIVRPASGGGDDGYGVLSSQQVQNALSFLMDTPASVPYTLPRHVGKLYQQQTEPVVRLKPQSIVYDVQKWQDANPMVSEPFERVLRKLPPTVRPSSAGPSCGPMHHPNEPLWFEMAHRLHGILKKQGRRAARRRKRRLQSKLFRGRAKNAPPKRDEGKELREYLDSHKAEREGYSLPGAVGARDPGEFLGKVHENYLINRERTETRPFRIRGAGTSFAGKKGVGELLERKQRVVRPVYVPPPPSSMPR